MIPTYGQILPLYSHGYRVNQTNVKHLYATELLSFKKKQHQRHGDMCHLSPIQLTSFQEELSLQHCQHPHYGGRDQNDFHRSHPAGLQQRSTLPQTTWKSYMCMLHFYKFQKTSHNDFPSRTDPSEVLHTAEDL